MFPVRSCIALIIYFFGGSAHASGWSGPFVINSLYVAGAENFHIRVSGFQAISGCTSAPTWAYINQSSPGFKEYNTALTVAYASGKPINIFWQPDANGYCQILELSY